MGQCPGHDGLDGGDPRSARDRILSPGPAVAGASRAGCRPLRRAVAAERQLGRADGGRAASADVAGGLSAPRRGRVSAEAGRGRAGLCDRGSDPRGVGRAGAGDSRPGRRGTADRLCRPPLAGRQDVSPADGRSVHQPARQHLPGASPQSWPDAGGRRRGQRRSPGAAAGRQPLAGPLHAAGLSVRQAQPVEAFRAGRDHAIVAVRDRLSRRASWPISLQRPRTQRHLGAERPDRAPVHVRDVHGQPLARAAAVQRRRPPAMPVRIWVLRRDAPRPPTAAADGAGGGGQRRTAGRRPLALDADHDVLDAALDRGHPRVHRLHRRWRHLQGSWPGR